MEQKTKQQIDMLDLLIQTLQSSEKRADRLLAELEILIGILSGRIPHKENLLVRLSERDL